ncbi:MAG: type IV secretion system protein [Polaromonas sp.]
MSGGLFSGLGSSIDSFLNVFVTTVSSSIATAITPLVLSGLTIWIMMYGYAVMRNEVSDPIGVFGKNVLKFSLIMGFALSGGLYQSEIIGSVNAFQDGLVSLVTQPSGITSVSGNNIYQVLDGLLEKGNDLALVMIGAGMSKFPMGGYLDLLAGVLVLAANIVLLLVCGGFVLITKVAMAFVLGVGPMFIACLAFPPVAKFFDAWAGMVLNYVFLIVILAFAIGLSISVSDTYMQNMLVSAQASATNSLIDAFSLIALYGTLIILIYQAPHLASGLAGGSSLSGVGLGNLAQSAVVGKLASAGKFSGGGSGGGSVGNASSGAGGGSTAAPSSSSNSAPGGRKPAYRRATMDNLANKGK